MTDHPDALTRLFRACEPSESLEPGDPRYVNLDEARGDQVVEAFERSIRRARPDAAEVKLFAGHRGVGKTSELLRLKSLLERDRTSDGLGRAFVVFYFDVGDSLDVNDLDFPDLLVATAKEVQEGIEKLQFPGTGAVTTYLKRVWSEIIEGLGAEVSISGAEVEIPKFGKLSLELRNRPNKRSVLREAIERHSTSLLEAVNDLLDTARAGARKSGFEGIVLIIDGLDKLVRRPVDDGASNSHERLFIDRSEQLASLHAHTIYTVPISLIYSPRCTSLEQTFGEFNQPVSMIRIRGEDRSSPTPETVGMRKMREMLERRCSHASTTMAAAFDDLSTADYLCEMTGGHPRHLMMFIQSAANGIDTLPITRAAAERAIRNYANSLRREIHDREWDALRTFATPRDDIPKDEIHQEMLYLLHVYEYMNGEPWYEVNPVVRILPKFTE